MTQQEAKELLLDLSKVPVSVVTRVMNANVFRQEDQKRYELDFSVFLKHYKAYITDDEIKDKIRKDQDHKDHYHKVRDLMQSRWLDCVNAFHGDIQSLDKKRAYIKEKTDDAGSAPKST